MFITSLAQAFSPLIWLGNLFHVVKSKLIASLLKLIVYACQSYLFLNKVARNEVDVQIEKLRMCITAILTNVFDHI